MPETLLKIRKHCNNYKPKSKQELNDTKSTLTPNLQSFKQKLLSGIGILVYK